jgi:hypothetical protein
MPVTQVLAVMGFAALSPSYKKIGGPEGPPIASSADRFDWVAAD